MSNDPDKPGYRREMKSYEIYEPDQIQYFRLPTNVPGVAAWVGYDGDVESYWFHMWRFNVDHLVGAGVKVGDVFYEGGPVPDRGIDPRSVERIPTLPDLLDLTWSEIDWRTAPLRPLDRLRDAQLFGRMAYLMSATGRSRRMTEISDFIGETFWEPGERPGHTMEGNDQTGWGEKTFLYGA